MSARRRQIIHVDMDAFFAAVEQRDYPELRGKPVLVGGPSRRGVVTAASYEARPYGVHSAMPMVEALRRCPEAIVVSGRHRRYSEVSAEVFAVFRRYTPLVEGVSVDEAFLDVTESQALFGPAFKIASQIRADIRRELDMTASAGLAASKFVAKIASDLDKPDGLVVVPDDVADFLAPLPIERMWGIGPIAAERMHEAGFHTIGDLARGEPGDLKLLLGSWGGHVHLLANGIDDRAVRSGAAAKSIGAEQTFEHDLCDAQQLRRTLLSHSARVAQRLFLKGLHGSVVTVKVKYADFTVRTSRMTIGEPVADTDTIYAAAKELLRRLRLQGRPVRLTGVSVGGLSSGPIQRSLFSGTAHARAEKLEEVSAQIRSRFGDDSVTRATLIK